jgi:TRAP transporter TAXI family solute receptor
MKNNGILPQTGCKNPLLFDRPCQYSWEMPAQKFKKIFQVSSVSIMDLFDVGPIAAFTALIAATVIVASAVVFFVRSAPPNHITISTGPDGGSFQRTAQKYAKILEENDVKVNIVTSQGSSDNLQKLRDEKSDIDVAMVQAGVANAENSKNLISLGSISQQPLLVFYRGKPMQLLSELKGKRIGIGPEGSGANQLAKTVLGLSGIKPEAGAKLEVMEADDAAKALQEGKLDAAFIMSESASFTVLKALMHSSEVRLYDFKQSGAYIRKLDYLNELKIPQGVIDIGMNLPSSDVMLIGPTVDLIAKKNLHPALSDLLLEAATQVHGRPGMFQQRNEFPSPIEHSVKISDDATRYYKSGKGFFYRYLPYWLASLLSRILVVFVPALVIMVPVIRMILSFFRWIVKTKIHRHYRELVSLERELQNEQDPVKRGEFQQYFDRIEDSVYKMRIKGSYADQIYGLRGHIDYVRRHFGQKV